MNGNIERAVKHWIIAANMGHEKAIQRLKKCYADGEVSKEDFAAALRAHHAAVEATKSPQREVGDKEVAALRAHHAAVEATKSPQREAAERFGIKRR
jgi:TPR repeat protein